MVPPIPFPTTGRETAAVRAAAVVVGLVLLVVGVVLDRTGWWGWAGELTDASVLVTALVVLAVAGLLTRVDAVWARRAGAVGAVVAGAAAAVLLVDGIADGLPGPAAGVLLVGTAAVVIAAVALAVGPPPRRRPLAGAALAVGLLAVAIVAGTVVDAPTRTTTDAPVTEAPVAATAGTVRWTYPVGGPVADVVPVRGGVAVLRGPDGPRTDAPFDRPRNDSDDDERGDEIVALDGTTGTPRWTFRHGRQRVDALVPSPGGGVLAVSHVLPDGGALVTVLDTSTGVTRFTVTTSTRRGALQLTDRVLTVLDARGTAAGDSSRDEEIYGLVAYRLDDGARAWTWDPPPGCALGVPWSPTLGPPGRWTLATRTVGVTPVDCGTDRVLTGLDEGTGGVRWTAPGVPRVTADGSTVAVEPTLTALPDGGSVLVGGSPAQVVDAATGATRPVPGLGEFDLGAVRPGPVRALALTDGEPRRSIDARTGSLVPLPAEAPGECSTPQGAVAVTDTATLRLCGVGAGFGLRLDAGPVLPLDLGPPALTGSDSTRDTLLYRRSEYVIVPAPGALVVATTRTDPATVVGVA
ncbi:PQQ-binding-like beta-propeller repeat protein [Actinomycetospora termitidis]|uniref:PQQ-binding-like beta-propeller repeat protein n=1 Tax=Actinomycetospora termitidis TaxID=3053470 RepID=A0ABT7MBS7_9PSEU|nr:PQQ-binding-like beta-propeller repeat protein [Actinomycetospora sp. Odt1-22]MDL5158088.1 PQQ-binding-like beta-propeller repeat protein [Actinomycetospora sp. Odt1-22]